MESDTSKFPLKPKCARFSIKCTLPFLPPRNVNFYLKKKIRWISIKGQSSTAHAHQCLVRDTRPQRAIACVSAWVCRACPRGRLLSRSLAHASRVCNYNIRSSPGSPCVRAQSSARRATAARAHACGFRNAFDGRRSSACVAVSWTLWPPVKPPNIFIQRHLDLQSPASTPAWRWRPPTKSKWLEGR